MHGGQIIAQVLRTPQSLQRTTSGTRQTTGEDLDGPKTVEEKVAKVSKVRLLRQFSYGVIAYVVATALVVLLPIFVSSAPGEEAVRVVLVMQNVVLWVFMAGLAWIFRRAAALVCGPAVTPHLPVLYAEVQLTSWPECDATLRCSILHPDALCDHTHTSVFNTARVRRG